MSQADDQAYIDLVIAHANRKQCSVEYRNLLDLWVKAEKDPELSESLCQQIMEKARRIRELYQQEHGRH